MDNNLEKNYSTTENKDFDIGYYLSLFARKRWIFLTILAVTMTLSAIYTFKQTPIYRATTTILIESPTSSLSLSETQKVRVSPQIYGAAYYNTQYKILESLMLVKRVHEKLNLPYPIEKLQSMISVEPVRKTRLVSINVDHKDPVAAAAISNMIAGEYINQNVESMLFMSKEILKSFPKEAENIKKHTLYGQFNELSEEDSIESLPPIAQDPLLRSLKNQKVGLQTQLVQLGSRYKNKHPKMIVLNSELAFVNEKIETETDRILKSVKADLAGRLQANNVRVINYAEVPKRPIKPQKTKSMVYGFLISSLLSIGVIFFTEYLDDTIKNQDDIEKTLGLPYLGCFSSIPETDRSTDSAIDFNVLDKKSDPSIAIRNIKTNILFSAAQERSKTLLITSTTPQEGKSFLSSYIAFAFAKDGKKTLLLDLDIRKPSLHTIFSKKRAPGITNLLVEDIELDNLIHKTKYDNLSLITAGASTPNPLELLNSDKMKDFMCQISNRFEKIIIDSSPGFFLPDAVNLSRLANMTLFVTKSGAISKDALLKLKGRFLSAGTLPIGVVLNFFEMKKHLPYHNKYYYSYYKRYYSSDTNDSKPIK